MMKTLRGLAVAASLVAAALTGGNVLAATDNESANVAAGQALVFDRSMGNCLACHTLKGGGDVQSNVGPELSDIKKNVPNRNELFAIIFDEEDRNSRTVMPAFGKNLILTPQQINQIIDFLYTR